MARRFLGFLAVAPLALWSGAVAGLTPREEAQAILDRWLEAQNAGRFDEYQLYYGDEFTGVRRSGSRTARFDRAGWLQDRKRMFEKPMKVSADNVHIYASAHTARVVFTQHWSSGRYADTGPKQLILRHGPDGFHIAREELFASDTREPGTIDLDAFRRFAFVVDGEVVVSQQADDAWGTGAPSLDKKGKDPFLYRTRRGVDTARLPPGVGGLVGVPMRLMDARGLRCDAKLGELFLRGRAFMGADDGADGDGLPDQSKEAAAAAWGESPHYLVARVVGDRKACAGATWARAAALPAIALATAEPLPPALKSRALAAFKALPASRSIQGDFERWYRGENPKGRRPPPWFEGSERKLAVGVLRPPSGPALLSVSARINDGSCADGVFGGLWALWEIDDRDPAQPRLILRNEPDPEMTLRPTTALDVDGDGTPELLFDNSSDWASTNAAGQPDVIDYGIVRALGGSYIQIEGPSTPIYLCPC